jgi:hypothetical protein
MSRKKATKPADAPESAIDKSALLARDGAQPIGEVEMIAFPVGEAEADAFCPVCGRLREMMAPHEPCVTCGKQLEDTP